MNTIIVLWLLLASGDVKYREFPSLADCQRHARLLQEDAARRGDTRYSALLCIPESRDPFAKEVQ